jgi:Ca2+-binding EF-hand superfamily protein
MARCVAVLCLVLSAILVLAPARAGDDGKKVAELGTSFQKLDANKDGRVNKPEFLKLVAHFKDQKKARTWLSALYDQIDTDKKGITRDQFKQFIDSKRKKDDK